MKVGSDRFGSFDVKDFQVIRLMDGLKGFPEEKSWVFVESPKGVLDGRFIWLQSAQTPSLAFVVCDPAAFVPGYRVPIGPSDMQSIGLSDIEQATVLVVVNKHNDTLTGNLKGPLVINYDNNRGVHLVLGDDYSVRHPLVVVAPTHPTESD